MSFSLKDAQLLTKYNEIWGKILKIVRRKKTDSDPVFDNKYLNQKLKPQQGRITTNVDDNV